MDERMTFKVTDENGKDIEYEVLFTFDSEDTNKSYMAYTDHTTDEEGNVRVYASIYEPDADPMKLIPIETDKEWNFIQTILEEIQATAEESKDE